MRQKTLNYLKQKQGGGNGSGPNSQQGGSQSNNRRKFTRLAPDPTVHVPPAFLFALGGLGIIFGIATNMWQWFTTFSAAMMLETPNAKLFSNQSQPFKYVIAAVIATAMQFGVLLIVFKVDSRWMRETKNRSLTGNEKAKAYGLAVVEIVQHLDVFSLYGIISFAVDTIGDYTFIAGMLVGIDPISTIALTFLYACSLYALSTVAFVRSVEYVWSGIAASARLLSQRRPHHP